MSKYHGEEIRFVRERIIFIEGMLKGCLRDESQRKTATCAIDDLRCNLKILEAIAEECIEPCNVCFHLECVCPEAVEDIPEQTLTEEPPAPKYTSIQDYLLNKDISK